MNIYNMFSNKKRALVLKKILAKSGVFTIAGIAEECGVSKSFVSVIMASMKGEKMATRRGRNFSLSLCAKTRAARIFLSLSEIDARLFRKYPFVEAAGIYGSVAKGENTEDSDIDMWLVIGSAPEGTIARLSMQLRERLGPVKPLYLTKERLARIRTEDPLFYHSLCFGSIIIYGDGIESPRV
jgi:predicted nucleotidyltransferase